MLRDAGGSLLIGLVFWLALFVPLLSWVVNVAWYAWAVLAASETVICAALTVGLRLLLRLRAWPLAVAGWWVTAEAVRDRWPWGGFPWGRLAMSQASSPAAPWAAIGGAPLVTFLVALVGAGLAWLILTLPGRPAGLRHAATARRHPSRRDPSRRDPSRQDPFFRLAGLRQAGHFLLPAAGLAAATGLAAAGALLPVGGTPAGTPTAVVAAVQGSVPHARDLPGLLRATTVTANHAAATRRLAAQVAAGRLPAPDLVIWPENSTDLDPGRYPPVYDQIMTAVDAIHRPVLVGAVLQDPVRNAGQLWLPGRGPVTQYIKRQLVPFGEVIPFRGLLSHITSLVNLQPRDFTPGHRAVVFRTGRIRLGDVICYEVGFDNLVRSEVRGGANLLAMQTNDATFEVDGQRGETLQQLAMARLRAVESGRSVVVASTTGISAIIGPDGRMLGRSDFWRREVLEARVPLLRQTTLADRLGAWPEYVIIALTVAAAVWAAAAGLGGRRPASGTGTGTGRPRTRSAGVSR